MPQEVTTHIVTSEQIANAVAIIMKARHADFTAEQVVRVVEALDTAPLLRDFQKDKKTDAEPAAAE